MPKIRILIADDHPLIRIGIRSTISTEPKFLCVGEAKDGSEIIPLCEKTNPDILLLDLRMPNLIPLEMVSQLKPIFPGLRIIILSAYNDEAIFTNLISSNVMGFILKEEMPDILLCAMKAIMRGDLWFSKVVMQKLALLRVNQQGIVDDARFTKREVDVLRMLVRGYTNRCIAKSLNITEPTVRFHLRNIYDKRGIHSRSQMLLWALQEHLESET